MVVAMDVITWAHLFVSDRDINQLEHVLHGSSCIRAIVAHNSLGSTFNPIPFKCLKRALATRTPTPPPFARR